VNKLYTESIKDQSLHSVSLSGQLVMKSMTHVTPHNKALTVCRPTSLFTAYGN